jgi:hypothetical protein
LTAEQKKILFISAAVPMVGFGFMDNMVMITMGGFRVGKCTRAEKNNKHV